MDKFIFIDGIDFTDDEINIPNIDYNIPEWGKVDGNIINESLQFEMSIRYRPFFDNGRIIQKIPVVIIDEIGTTIFDGLIDRIDYANNKLSIYCKGLTTILFNSYIQSYDGTVYVIDDAYPVDIVKEILILAGFEMDAISYTKALAYQKTYDIKFDVTVEKLSYIELLERICDVTCSKLYIMNNKFYYEMFNPDSIYASISIENDDWITYPTVENPPGYSTVFNGVNVNFGAGFTWKRIRNASKIIDVSTGNIIYTSSLTTAEFIGGLYDYLGYHKKKKINCILRKEFEMIINKTSYIEWDGDVYGVLNINNQSNIGLNLIGEAIIR